ncbi:hypothetical protein DPMN_062624, partial [Dreissena polymorpha]
NSSTVGANQPTNRPTNQQTNRQGKNNMSPTTIGVYSVRVWWSFYSVRVWWSFCEGVCEGVGTGDGLVVLSNSIIIIVHQHLMTTTVLTRLNIEIYENCTAPWGPSTALNHNQFRTQSRYPLNKNVLTKFH